MAINIEKTLTEFRIENNSKGFISISKEDEGIIYNQLEHLYDELLMIYTLKLNSIFKGKCNKCGKCE